MNNKTVNDFISKRKELNNGKDIDQTNLNKQTTDAIEEARIISRDSKIKGFTSMADLKASLDNE